MKWFLHVRNIVWKTSTNFYINKHLLNRTNQSNIFVFAPSFLAGIFFTANIDFKKIDFFEKYKTFLLPSVIMANENGEKRTKTYNLIADAVELVAPSVVNVEVSLQRNHYRQNISSSGSGFIVTEDGMILTNAHVVNSASHVDIKLPTGESMTGVIVDVDVETDLAAIKIVEKSKVTNKMIFPYVKLGKSSEVRAGEWVAALGSPLRLSNTVTSGIVSTLHRPSGELGLRHKDMGYIQTDAAINIGNSGGPLINLDGEVIGINCITVQQAVGISFAIPSDIASEFLDGAIRKEKHLREGGVFTTRAKKGQKFYIGISMLTLTPGILFQLQQRNPTYFGSIKEGVFVARVTPGSPSERYGIVTGDVITSINNKPIRSSHDVFTEVRKGESMLIDIQRGANKIMLKIQPEITSRL